MRSDAVARPKPGLKIPAVLELALYRLFKVGDHRD
jgi:hypothetical protein